MHVYRKSKLSNFTVVARKCRHYSVEILNLEKHFIVTMEKRNLLEPSSYFIPIGGKNSEYTFLFHFFFSYIPALLPKTIVI